jgi:hypothetical protein
MDTNKHESGTETSACARPPLLPEGTTVNWVLPIFTVFYRFLPFFVFTPCGGPHVADIQHLTSNNLKLETGDLRPESTCHEGRLNKNIQHPTSNVQPPQTREGGRAFQVRSPECGVRSFPSSEFGLRRAEYGELKIASASSISCHVKERIARASHLRVQRVLTAGL